MTTDHLLAHLRSPYRLLYVNPEISQSSSDLCPLTSDFSLLPLQSTALRSGLSGRCVVILPDRSMTAPLCEDSISRQEPPPAVIVGKLDHPATLAQADAYGPYSVILCPEKLQPLYREFLRDGGVIVA